MGWTVWLIFMLLWTWPGEFGTAAAKLVKAFKKEMKTS